MREYGSLDDAIRKIFGETLSVIKMSPVSGGDINNAFSCILSDGTKLFMKSNLRKNIDFFRKEAAGLNAIKRTGAIKTPDVLGLGVDKDCSFLLLSFIQTTPPVKSYMSSFGRRLASMHDAVTESYTVSGRFGFVHDDYIGAGYQVNNPKDTWLDFFRDCRLKPQFTLAERYFAPAMIKKAERLLERLDSYLIEPDSPSLLHGDLWYGNYIVGNDGEVWLIDPAVYVGHAEADIAMTELFGGFSPDFYSAYREERPLAPGYEDRKDLYNLYHLLNHLNLFGAGYLHSVQNILNRYA